jgi:hypothetical protein
VYSVTTSTEPEFIAGVEEYAAAATEEWAAIVAINHVEEETSELGVNLLND